MCSYHVDHIERFVVLLYIKPHLPKLGSLSMVADFA